MPSVLAVENCIVSNDWLQGRWPSRKTSCGHLGQNMVDEALSVTSVVHDGDDGPSRSLWLGRYHGRCKFVLGSEHQLHRKTPSRGIAGEARWLDHGISQPFLRGVTMRRGDTHAVRSAMLRCSLSITLAIVHRSTTILSQPSRLYSQHMCARHRWSYHMAPSSSDRA